MFLEFLLTSIVVILLPGTGVIYTLSIGLSRGFLPSISAAFGCTLGIIPAAIACIIGLAALLHTSALAFQIIKYLGVLYLFYMAWGILKSGNNLEIDEDNSSIKSRFSHWKIIINGALLNVLNPKLSLFFLAFLPQFVSADATKPTLMLMVLAGIFMTLTFIVFVGYGACAAQARDYVISRPKIMVWLKYAFASTFGALGIKLALSER